MPDAEAARRSLNYSITVMIDRFCSVFNVDLTDELIDEYTKAVDDLEPSCIQVATDELIKESTFMPKPAEIRRAAKRIAAESSSKPAEPEHWRRDTYRCQICRDTGYVTIWHPRAMAAAIAYLANKATEDTFRRNQYPAAAKCTCQRGQDCPGSTRTYNPDSDVKIDQWSHGERVKALLERAKNFKPPNYVPEFDEWRGDHGE